MAGTLPPMTDPMYSLIRGSLTLSNPLTQLLSPPPLIPGKLAREDYLYFSSFPSPLVSGSNDRPCTQGAGKGERVGLVQPVQVRDQYSNSNEQNLKGQ